MKDGTFTAGHLLALYDRVAEAEDAIPRLRRFVLDLAVRGKLVEQDPSDEPAAELLKRIAKEKARLVKAGEIRKPKPFEAVEDAPFDVPGNWAWSRIREVTTDRGQMIPNMRFTYIDVSAINKEVGVIEAPTVLEPAEAPSRARKIVRKGDVIYSCVRPYLLNVAVVEDEIEPAPIASTAFAIINGLGLILPRFIWIVLRSPFMVTAVEETQRGQAYPAINDADFAVLPFPLPPLAEQQRIVAKVDELMALCDGLQAARAGREVVRDRLTAASLARLTAPETDAETYPAHARFALQSLPTLTTRPDQIKTLRQTILNLAVRGKLVEQDPTDEPAAELLKRIRRERNIVRKRSATFQPVTEDAQNFPTPTGWIWQRFGEVFSIRTGFAFQSPTYTDSGILVLRVINFDRSGTFDFSDAKYFPAEKVDTKISQFLLRAGEILMVMVGGTIGKTTVIAEEILPALLNQNMWRIRSYGELMNGSFEHMLIRCLNQNIENLTNSTHGHFAMSDFEQKSICVPPLAEQHRIVAKVGALMALCDQLEASLTTTTTTRSRLLEALLHEALGGQTEVAE